MELDVLVTKKLQVVVTVEIVAQEWLEIQPTLLIALTMAAQMLTFLQLGWQIWAVSQVRQKQMMNKIKRIQVHLKMRSKNLVDILENYTDAAQFFNWEESGSSVGTSNYIIIDFKNFFMNRRLQT